MSAREWTAPDARERATIATLLAPRPKGCMGCGPGNGWIAVVAQVADAGGCPVGVPTGERRPCAVCNPRGEESSGQPTEGSSKV